MDSDQKQERRALKLEGKLLQDLLLPYDIDQGPPKYGRNTQYSPILIEGRGD